MLLLVELRRFFRRRFGLVMSLAVVGTMGVILVISMANSHKPSANDIEYAKAEAARDKISAQAEYEECLLKTDLPKEVDGDTNYYSGRDCSRYDPDLVDASDYLYGVITFTEDAPELMYAFGCLVAIAGLVTAASFVGAEWPSGGMTNLMLWKPRRMEVFFSKLGASVITVVIGSLGLGGVFLFLLWLVTLVGGYVGDLNAAWLGQFVEQNLRVAVLPVLMTLLGFSIAMLGRRTAAALGFLAGYAVVFEVGLRLIAQVLPGLYYLEAATMSPYAIAWLAGEYHIEDNSYRGYDVDYRSYEERGIDISSTGGIIVLVVFAVVMVAAAAVTFQRRDVANN